MIFGRRNIHIHLEIDGGVRIENNNEIRAEDGTIVNLEISLISNRGKVVNATHYGTAGQRSAGFFSDIPKTMDIGFVKISSDKIIRIKKVTWHQFNPL